jgi:hypothetical protein
MLIGSVRLTLNNKLYDIRTQRDGLIQSKKKRGQVCLLSKPWASTNLYGKQPHLLLRASSQVKPQKITVSGIPRHIRYCVIFMVYRSLTNVAAGRITQLGGSRVRDV